MKILRSFIAVVAMAGIMSFTSCSDDWGKSDPIPGTGVNPVKEVVGTYTFEYSEDVEPLSDMNAVGGRVSEDERVTLEVVEDEALGSNVLHLDSGYVRMVNPFVGSKGLQNGAAITMWIKTDSVTLHSALFAFGGETMADENSTERFFFSENSWLSYTKPGQLVTLNLDENNPENMKTGALTNDKDWHFIALQLKSDGYVFYVDGYKKAQQDLKAERTTQFSYSNLLTFLETVPYLYIGAGNDSILAETWIDDVTIYRNMMDAKDWNKKRGGGTGPVIVGGDVDYMPEGTMGFFKFNGSFADALGLAGEVTLVSVESQTNASDFEEDAERGIVWHQQEGWRGHGNGYSYLDIPNPLKGLTLTGATVAFWVKPSPIVNWWDSVWGMSDGDGHMWFNENGYLGFNAAGQWFDCQQDNGDNALAAEQWTHVAMVFTTTGFRVYYNGVEKFSDANNAKWASSGAIDYTIVLNYMANSPSMQFGYGSFWGASGAYISDLAVLDHDASAAEVGYIYLMTSTKAKSLFSFGGTFADSFDASQEATLISVESQGTASDFEEDAVRGMVWHQQEGWRGHGNGYSYLDIPNPFKGLTLTGATVAFWVKPSPIVNWWDSVWGMSDGDGHMWFNENGYLGFNAAGQWFDCQQDNGDNALAAEQWTHVAMVFTTTGFRVYYNGVEKFSDANNAKWASSGAIDYTTVLNYMANSPSMQFGYGSFWGASGAYVSDLFIYPAAMTGAEVSSIYAGTKK